MLTAQYQPSFSLLGKLLLTKKPEIARALISEYMPVPAQPIETDLNKIPAYFQTFCDLQQINPKEYTGALYKSSKIDKRRLFVAVIILMYHPRTRLVAKYISETIGQDPSNTVRLIKEAGFRYNKLEEFRGQVDAAAKSLIQK